MKAAKTCRIDGAKITGMAQIHDKLAADLGFPAYYMRNLDALWDVLTGDLEGPAEIEITNAHSARARLGPDFDALIGVLREAARENGELQVTVSA